MAAMNDRMRRILSQKTTWLGLTSIIVIVLQSLGLDIDDPTREAITETLLVISGLVLVLVEPRPAAPKPSTLADENDGNHDNPGHIPGRPLRPGGAADLSARTVEGENDGGAKAP